VRIGIPSDTPDLEARVGHRLGTSQYLLVVDVGALSFEAVPNPAASGRGSGGMEAVVLAISKKVDTILTGYCSPIAKNHLTANGIDVLTGVTGTVSEVVRQYKMGALQKPAEVEDAPEDRRFRIIQHALFQGLRDSSKQFSNLLPILIGVVLLVGLFNSFVSRKFIATVFSGIPVLDTLMGTCLGALFSGNPINSYIIGGELLHHGVSLYAVTAFIISWVSVGVIQLPAEMGTLGSRFALVRIAASFVLSMVVAIATVVVLNFMKGLSP